MNIAILDFDDIQNPLLSAGQAKTTFEIGKLLVERGHVVEVICSHYPGSKDRTENGIRYHHIGISSTNLKLNNALYILALPFVVKSLKVDIIIECFTAPISTLMSPLWTKIPVVGLPSSFNAHSFSSKYHLPFYLIEQYGARLYKYFLPFTQYHEDKMKQLNRNIISSVVPEGVTEDFFTINRKTPKYILFLGRMDIHQKGIDLLLESYARIADRISYPLVIAGNGPDETSVKELVYKKGLKKQVTFIGPTYGDKKRRVLSEAACVAFTSRYESFSVFALEALASGVPFVCYDIPGLSWINTPFVNKIKPYDTTQFGNAIEQVSSKKNVGLTSGLRSFARKFTWEKTVDKYEAFFNTIVHQETYKFRLSHNHLNR